MDDPFEIKAVTPAELRWDNDSKLISEIAAVIPTLARKLRAWASKIRIGRRVDAQESAFFVAINKGTGEVLAIW